MDISDEYSTELEELRHSHGRLNFLLAQDDAHFMDAYRSIPMRKMGEIAFERALDMLSGKWKIVILTNLFKQPSMRYSEIKKSLLEYGITNHMLNTSLRELMDDRLVEKTVYPEVPPHTEYYVTDKAKELLRLMLMMGEWFTRHRIEELRSEDGEN